MTIRHCYTYYLSQRASMQPFHLPYTDLERSTSVSVSSYQFFLGDGEFPSKTLDKINSIASNIK